MRECEGLSSKRDEIQKAPALISAELRQAGHGVLDGVFPDLHLEPHVILDKHLEAPAEDFLEVMVDHALRDAPWRDLRQGKRDHQGEPRFARRTPEPEVVAEPAQQFLILDRRAETQIFLVLESPEIPLGVEILPGNSVNGQNRAADQ